MQLKHPMVLIMSLLCLAVSLFASDPIRLPNGLTITPDAAPRSVLLPLNPGLPGRRDLAMGEAVTTSLSPDGRTLLVLTSGYNKEGPEKLNEYIFVFDVTANPPRQI